MLGTGISQLIPILFSPFLTRIYNPASFGSFAVFVAISVIIAMVASGLFEYVIVLPKEDSDAQNVVWMIFFLSLFVSIFALAALLVINYFYLLEGFYYLLPLGIIFTVALNVISNWYNRYKKYKQLNFFRIFQAVLIVGGSFLFSRYADGLIYGYLLGGFFSFLLMVILLIRIRKSISIHKIKALALEHKKFPLVVMPSSLMNTFSSYAPVFFIKRSYTSSQLGYFSMSTRVLTAPISVVSNAIGQVYFKNLTDYQNNEENYNIKKYFYKSAIMLAGLSLIIFVPLFFLGTPLCVLVFGENWAEAGSYIGIVALASMIKFVVSPLSMLLIVKKQLTKVARWQTIYFFTSLTVFLVGCMFDIKVLLWLYVVHETILYSVYFYIITSVIQD